MESIGAGAFEDCNSLTSIRVLAKTPPTVVVRGYRYGLGFAPGSTIHVYDGLGDVYRSANYWREYTIIDDIGKKVTISANADAGMGSVSGGGVYTKDDEVILIATGNNGYQFQRWSDGSTANPYVFTATEDKSINAEFTKGSSGTCGDDQTWSLEDGILTISGAGSMRNYSEALKAPWHSSYSAISAVVIKEGVTSIGNWAFCGCSSLTSVTISKSVTSIGDRAFYDADNISDIYCFSVMPPSCSSTDVFSNKIYETANVYIPNSNNALMRYLSADVWKNFYNIHEKDVTSVDTPAISPLPAERNYYNLQGQRSAAPTRSLNIINGKKTLMH